MLSLAATWPCGAIGSFASTVGATLAFLVSRYLLRDTIKQRFPERLDAIDAGVEKEGGFYLFTLRLVPVFPFFLINLLMGATSAITWCTRAITFLNENCGVAFSKP